MRLTYCVPEAMSEFIHKTVCILLVHHAMLQQAHRYAEGQPSGINTPSIVRIIVQTTIQRMWRMPVANL